MKFGGVERLTTNKLFDLAHKWWIGIQLGSPPLVQRILIPHLHEAKEIARLLLEPYLTVYQWQGQNEGGSLTVNYAGLGYTVPLLKHLLFTQYPIEKEIDRVPLWQSAELVRSSAGDIIIVEASKYLIRKLPRQNAITLPFRLQFTLDIRGKWQEIEERFHRNVRRNARKSQGYDSYEWEISQRQQDLEIFYHTMYLPTMHQRHGDLAVILPEEEAYELLRHGWLFLLKRNGVYVCGSLGYAQQDTVDFKEMGVLNGDLKLMNQGVVEAMNYLRIRWAYQEGYKWLSFGDNWPYLSGIFRAKRKWGSIVSIPSYEHKQLWVRIQRCTPAVSEFLQKNPCVISDEQEKLYGLIVTPNLNSVTPQMGREWYKLYATPGLTDLLIRSPIDLITQPVTSAPNSLK